MKNASSSTVVRCLYTDLEIPFIFIEWLFGHLQGMYFWSDEFESDLSYVFTYYSQTCHFQIRHSKNTQPSPELFFIVLAQ